TRTWGYIVGAACPTAAQDTYLGPVIVNTRGGASTDVTWVNELGNSATTGVLAYKYNTDQTLHWADPLKMQPNCAMMGGVPAFGSDCAQNYVGAIPTVPHLHGGEVPPEIDGAPEGWFTGTGLQGPAYYSAAAGLGSATYKYPNAQEAGPLWFHDHTLGVTRLNVYAGMAGVYYLQDPTLNLPTNLPPLTEVVPVIIQDRMFDTNGQLYFPGDSSGGVLSSPNPEHPYWVPEFVGDTIVVNGKAWPFLNIAAKRHRFLFLNGSNARTYELSLINQATGATGPAMYVIGTDGGYLDKPVKLDPALGQVLTMMPGERYEVIVDFSASPNTNFVMRNTGRTPFPKGAPPKGSTLGRVMQFRVGAAVADASYNPATGAALRSGAQSIVRLANPATGTTNVVPSKTRLMTLNEVMGMPQTVADPVTGVMTAYPGGPLEILVNNTKWSGQSTRPNNDFTPITVNGTTIAYSELPKEGDTEIWEIVNITADAHPIHLHLVQFQLLSRQGFNTNNYNAAYAAAFPTLLFQPAYGPPRDYDAAKNALSGGKFGGNPDVAPFLQGPLKLPLAQEAGWKDTIIMYPGEVTRIAVRYAPTDLALNTAASNLHYPFDPSGGLQYGYVWHCHIIDHEDNEMMRPKMVQLNNLAPAAALRRFVKGLNY
ncbi:MAG: multicopper oxidase domain-containing protein, partial [Gammaproteobacteria bacterium]|nr:multicopper oxidase domain-containing protein [Gammaproteobacteria bacterium]